MTSTSASTPAPAPEPVPAPEAVPAPARRRVAVVFGGRSSEHAVSCHTARGVLAALDPTRWDVVPIGVARDGRWVLAAGSAVPALTAGGAAEVDGDASPVLLPPGGTGLTVVPAGEPPREIGSVDVVLPLLHGPFGEDGTLQGLLEMSGVRYVGSGVLASAVAMDKPVAKVVLAAAGLPVGRWVLLAPDAGPQRVREQVAPLGLPVFVKPARAGSSFGITRVEDLTGLDAAVAAAAAHDPRVIVEAAVAGRELECGVLARPGGGTPDTSVVGEVTVGAAHAFYDSEAKYGDDSGTGLAVPADLPPGVADRVRAAALTAWAALGCEGLARVDFFLRPDGGLVVNEVNTMPGFTEQSMFPRLWAASGLDYPALVDRLLETALARPLGLR